MAVARSPLTPRRACRPLLTASLSDPQPPPAAAAAAAGGERAGKWLHQQSSVRPGYIRGYISPGGGGGGGNTSGNCGEKSEREENAEKGTYCQRLLWLRRRNKVVVVLLELHQEVHLAAGRCQKGKFGSDRCTQGGGGGGGGWTHLLPAKKWGQRIQFWGSAVHNKERCQPSDFSPLQHWILGGGGGNVYIRDPDLYRAAWFLALPNPMNRVLLLIYPKHQISPLL